MKAISNEGVITFKCGCPKDLVTYKASPNNEGKLQIIEVTKYSKDLKEWIIRETDEKGIKEQPDKSFVVHECDNVIIYQEKKGLKRFFKNKLKSTP